MLIPEIVGCGVFDSSISFQGLSKSAPRKVGCFEIEYYPEGGKSSFIDGIEYPVLKGNIVVAKPGQIRSSLLHIRNHYIWLAPCEGQVCSRLKELPDVMNVAQNPSYAEILSDIRREREMPSDASDMLLCAKVMELVYNLCADGERWRRRKNALTQDNRSCGGIIKASAFIDREFRADIKLSDIAKEAGLSPTYFHRLFSVIMGKTPHKYLLDRRLAAAKDALLSKDAPLSDVALDCGFCSQSYFNSVFRREVGITPGEYRREKLNIQKYV